jgi:dienelactone hydrolase
MNTKTNRRAPQATARKAQITAGSAVLDAEWHQPAEATGLAIFAHGSGSSRYSSRNQAVARALQESVTGTLLFDLLTREEEAVDARTGHLRFDIGLLAQRLGEVTRWVTLQPEGARLGIGYFGSSTGAAAALVAAAELGPAVDAVVSRGGRPDLADDALAQVQAPTLLIVGECDEVVLRLNEEALEKLTCQKELAMVPRATHLFEEPGALEEVASLSAAWFQQYLKPR